MIILFVLIHASCSRSNPYKNRTQPPSSKIKKLYDRQQFQAAEKELEKKLARNPEDLASILWLGKVYSRQYLHSNARQQLEKVLEMDPDNLEAIHSMAKVDSEEHKIEDATMNFQKAIELSPEDPSVYSDFGYFYLENQNAEHFTGKKKAKEAFDKALEISPGYVPALAGMGRLYCALLEYDKAEGYLRKAIKIDPGYDLAHVFLGEVLFRKGKFAESEEQYKEAVKVSPENPNNYFELGEFYYDTGKFDSALATYKKGSVANPENKYSRIGALRVLGQIYITRGDFDKAENNLRELVELDPENAPTRTIMGDFYFEQNRDDEAEKEYEAALKANPRFFMAIDGLGHVYLARKEYDKAEAAFRKSIEINPETPGGYIGLGLLLNELKKYDKAEEAYKKVLVLNPANIFANVGIADSLLGRGDVDQALALYQKTLDKAGSHSASIYISIGKALMNKGMTDQAAEQFRKAGLINSYEADAECGLGDIELLKGDYAKAESFFMKALKKHPGYAYAMYRLAITLLAQGKKDQAAELGKRLLKKRPPLTGRFEAKEKAYLMSYEKTPREVALAKPYIGLMKLYIDRGEFDKASLLYSRELNEPGKKNALKDPAIKRFVSSPDFKPEPVK
ncbi:MAG: tetratricopeptide repeat protein [Chloroflexi bacterium]|nr:tetratricopeptide repeat protein [Chloroflexota bacterium]